MLPFLAPLPAALDDRGTPGVLHCQRRQTGKHSAYFYFEEEPGRRAAAKLLTRAEARRIALNIPQAARSC